MHLVGTPLAVILPFSFFPFGVYLTYIYFSTSISHDLLDAARVDGANEFKVFRRIAMPLAMPVIALVGFFSVVTNWNNYFLPFVMVPGRKAPIQVGLAELISNVPLFNPTTVSSITISLPQLALATVISIVPVLIVFLFSQRFLVAGLTAGATKEVGPPSERGREDSEWRAARFSQADARRAPSCPRLRNVFTHCSRGGLAVAGGDCLADGAVLLERQLGCVVGGDALKRLLSRARSNMMRVMLAASRIPDCSMTRS
jgi:hypothetical protein